MMNSKSCIKKYFSKNYNEYLIVYIKWLKTMFLLKTMIFEMKHSIFTENEGLRTNNVL